MNVHIFICKYHGIVGNALTLLHIGDRKSAFELFMTQPIQNIFLNMTNLEGCFVYGILRKLDLPDLQAC